MTEDRVVYARALNGVAGVLKRRFNNLTAEELIALATDVLEAVYRAEEAK